MRNLLPLILCVAGAMASATFMTTNTEAQGSVSLVGTWAWVSVETATADGSKSHPFGLTPAGVLMFDKDGRFAWIISRPGRAKFAANSRDKGTPEENLSVVQGSFALTGTYSISDSTLTFKIDASSYPNAEGTEQKRSVTLTADELRWSNPATSTGAAGLAVLRRVK
jgi:hypothetical protein